MINGSLRMSFCWVTIRTSSSDHISRQFLRTQRFGCVASSKWLAQPSRDAIFWKNWLLESVVWRRSLIGSHFDLPPSSIHNLPGLGGRMVWTLTYAHRRHWTRIAFDCSRRCAFIGFTSTYSAIAVYKTQSKIPSAKAFIRPFGNIQVILIPKTVGNRKRDCVWGCARGINTTWENLQIEKHKSVRWAERTPSWFVLFDLQIFSGGVCPPNATSRTISFFYFQ